ALFSAEYVNVQPHSGSQANMAAYMAFLKPGDCIMGMSLAAGGHLTHGHAVNFSGTLYKIISYGVNQETETLDYHALEALAQEHKPKLIIAGASAYSRFIDFRRFRDIAQRIGAIFMVDMAHIAGLVAAEVHPSPIPFADCITSTTHKTLRGPRGGLILCKQEHAERVDRAVMPGIQGGPFMHAIAAKAVGFHYALQATFRDYQQQVVANARNMAMAFQSLGYRIVSGGTDNHLFVIDLSSQNITGRAAEIALEQAGISVSRSCIPFDQQKPWITSGIRIGTPAITARAISEPAVLRIVALIHEVLQNHQNIHTLETVKREVHKICKDHQIKDS
ncbi:MAG TPA: serine hydroxymethyltransferase, partial [Candidatus Babeliaceae bacterium]|nr:serine hydroxymethyltransferase [Candidatus Babeliaceae bacterium]